MATLIRKRIKTFVSAAVLETAVPEKAGEVWGTLLRRNIERFNMAAIKGIYWQTTGYELSPEASRFYLLRAYATYGSCALLRTHPYLLAFAAFANGEPLMREGMGPRGFQQVVTWRGDAVRDYVYFGPDGALYRAAVPPVISLHSGSGNCAVPLIGNKKFEIPVTAQGASVMARMAVPADMPRVPMRWSTERHGGGNPAQITAPPAQMPLPF